MFIPVNVFPMTQPGPVIVGGLLVFGMALEASAQPPAVPTPEDATVAFVDVSLIRMDRERVETGQTVLTRGDRITAIGARSAVTVPEDAIVIQGEGRYLTPGLTDAHVHLVGDGTRFGGGRPDFGDAPLYLAYGVTTVFNLRGTPEQLDWRRRIESGELVGPTIYTSGQYVNEPRVNSPDEVRTEVIAQARDGYDLIKFHEIRPGADRSGTSTGLSLPAYLTMNETAREAGLPLLGHAPVNLGLDALLQARQSLAHVGMLTNIHFLPAVSNFEFFVVTGVALLILMVVVIAWGVATVVARRGREAARQPPAVSRLRALTGWVLAGSLVAAGCAALFLPGGPLFDSLALRVVFTALGVLISAATVALVLVAIGVWRDSSASRFARLQGVLASLAGFGFMYAALMFWIPVAWRSNDTGIERLAERLADTGIWIQTSMVVYDAVGGPGRPVLVDDPAMEYLQEEVRARWLRIPQRVPSWYRYPDFTKKVVGALHRAGVPLMAGTDAMGFPLITPGSSLHRELQLLVESGLTPYQAVRAATVVPASFLGKEGEFGTIAIGRRADLLLVEDNPFENIGHLRSPVGVMVRGKWISRSQLEQMLDALRPGHSLPTSVGGELHDPFSTGFYEALREMRRYETRTQERGRPPLAGRWRPRGENRPETAVPGGQETGTGSVAGEGGGDEAAGTLSRHTRRARAARSSSRV